MAAETVGIGLVGWDTYPLLLTSQLSSLEDLWRLVSTRLMGDYIAPSFYRPLLSLVAGISYRLWGLWAPGYQILGATLYALCGCALFRLAQELWHGRRTVAPWVSTGFFLVYPTHIEVVPVLARWPELLAGGLMMVAVSEDLRAYRTGRRRTKILALVVTGLAICAKETAFALPALLWVAGAACRPGTRRWRMWAGALSAAPHLAVAVLLFVVRWWVLGGLGGHLGPSPNWRQRLDAALRYPELLVAPQPDTRVLAISAFLALIMLTVVLGWLARRQSAEGRAPSSPALPLALAWIVVAGVLYVLAGRVQPWYLPIPALGLALLVGVVASNLEASIRHFSSWWSAPAGVLLLAYVLLLASASPLFHHYDEWREATELEDSYLAEVEATIRNASVGSVVTVAKPPGWVAPRTGEPTIFGGAILRFHSLTAWAALQLRDRRVHFYQESSTAEPDDGGVTVVVESRRRPPA